MPDLTTISEIKDHLGISDGSEDTQLTLWLDAVEDAISTFTGRFIGPGETSPFTSYQTTEYHNGDGHQNLWLKRYPVTAIASIHVDQNGYHGDGTNAFPSDSEWTAGTDFAKGDLAEIHANRGKVTSLRKWGNHGLRAWPDGVGNIKVIYTAGYATIPDDLSLAAILMVSDIRSQKEAGGGGPLKSERHSRYAYERLVGEDASKEILRAREILLGYRDKRGVV